MQMRFLDEESGYKENFNMNKPYQDPDRGPTDVSVKHFVELISVDGQDQVQEYQSLLDVNDIPCRLSEQDNGQFSIMVPEEYLDEAHVVIESQDAYEDFYDFGIDDDEDIDIDDSDFFDSY